MSADEGSASGPTRGAQVYHLADAFQRVAGVNALASRKATQRLRLGACKAKELLSTSDAAHVRRPVMHHIGLTLSCVFTCVCRQADRGRTRGGAGAHPQPGGRQGPGRDHPARRL